MAKRIVAKLKVEVIRKQYWACSIPEHRHTTEAIATACIADQTWERKKTNHWNEASRAALLSRYRAGETMTAIGRSYGVSCANIGSLIRRAERAERYKQYDDEQRGKPSC